MIVIPHAWPNPARRGGVFVTPVPLVIGKGGKPLKYLPLYPYRVGSSIENEYFVCPVRRSDLAQYAIGMIRGYNSYADSPEDTRLFKFMDHCWRWHIDAQGYHNYSGKRFETLPENPTGATGRRFPPLRCFERSDIPEKSLYPKEEYAYCLFQTYAYEKNYDVITPVIYSADITDFTAYTVYKCYNVRNQNIIGALGRWEDLD